MTDKAFEEGVRKAGRALGEEMQNFAVECFATAEDWELIWPEGRPSYRAVFGAQDYAPPPTATAAARAVSEWLKLWLDQSSASWSPAPIFEREADFDDDPWAGGPYGL